MKAHKLPSLVPTQVRITQRIAYEVVWCDCFPLENVMGECRYDTKQIVIKKNLSPTETFKTFLHEVFHAVSFEQKHLNLTENQVVLLEQSVFRVLKLNSLI